jgi:ribonuclease HI
MNYILYTDGACSGNPGPGGFGSILFDGRTVIELGKHFSSTTNNRMELQGVISGLVMIQKQLSVADSAQYIQIYTDSVYVIKGITQWIFGWMKKNWVNSENESVVNKDLWMQLYKLVHVDLKDTKFKWDYVRGHNNDPGNERCDQIAVAFSKHQPIDLIQCPLDSYLFDISKPPKTEKIPENNWSKSNKEKKKSWYISLINGVVTKYATWSECEAQVKGRPAVKFKKVSSAAEEEEVLKQWGR